jgi:hypothetical protein
MLTRNKSRMTALEVIPPTPNLKSPRIPQTNVLCSSDTNQIREDKTPSKRLARSDVGILQLNDEDDDLISLTAVFRW